jgi:voltage-gated potassium channel
MKKPSLRTQVQPRSADRSAKQLGLAVIILIMTVVIGTVGYIVIEGWSFSDAVYMTIISLTTTGFTEVRPLSEAGRGLTVFVIVTGIASLAHVGGRVLQLTIELYLIRRGRMDRQIQRLRGHVILCGFGRMGRHIAEDLAEAGVPFVVLESDAENVYTTLTAKAINPDITIVARALSDESAPKLRTAGADRVIKPYEMVGRRDQLAELSVLCGIEAP